MVAVAQQASGQSGCRPVVKWVGGKGRLVPQLLARAPQTFDRYFEPFAGGAALFFALRPARAVLGDANADLIACYRAIASDVEAVIAELERHQRKHSEEHYYETRDGFNSGRFSVTGRAAAFLYLNRAGYNGLYRVNKAGEFNVSFGKAPEVRFDLGNIRAAARVLAGVELRAGSYEQTLAGATAGDFVYLDPPYDQTFNAYTADAFDQAELARVARELAARGVHVLLSNSDTPRIRDLYAGMDISVVRSPRSVNADGAGRGDVDELLITATRKESVTMPVQTEIPGCEDPSKIPAVEAAINEWLDAKTAQKRAADESKVKHQTIVALYAEHGIEHHTYTDPKTGKPKRLWLKKEPKATSTSIAVQRAPKKKGRRGGADREADAVIGGEEAAPDKDAEKVEFRRVPRSSVEKEVDGFASIRERMEAKKDENAKKAKKKGGKS